MEKVLDGLLEERDTLAEQINTKGLMPRQLCEFCRDG